MNTPTLSKRRQEVFDLIGQGFDNHQIAGQLGISAKTVSSDLYMLRLIMGCKNSRELVMLAVKATNKK
jgi:DNA-binding CsgD family transcriptional regulator